jgi:Zn finger protein HypA/HybF involved in hydrogenase expression
MGSAVTAACDCGLTANILVGGGMSTFTTECYFPCLCRGCRNIVQVNLLAPDRHCPACDTPNAIPYDSSSLSGTPGPHQVVEWNIADDLGRKLALNNGTYECPTCGEMSLRFSPGGMCWD